MEGVFKDILCACMVLYAPFPLNCYATWPCSEKVICFLLNRKVCRLNICYQVAAFVIPFIWCATWPFSDKVEFWPFTPTLGQGGGVCRQNICKHAAAFAIPFNLICNMTMFWKKKRIFTFWPHPLKSCKGRVVCAQNICYHIASFRDSL